jgi:hypothetical protein
MVVEAEMPREAQSVSSRVLEGRARRQSRQGWRFAGHPASLRD